MPIDLDLIHQKAFSIKKPPWGGGRISSQGLAFFASGRQDSNLRHLAPKQFFIRPQIGHFAGLTPVLTGFYAFVCDRLRPS